MIVEKAVGWVVTEWYISLSSPPQQPAATTVADYWILLRYQQQRSGAAVVGMCNVYIVSL